MYDIDNRHVGEDEASGWASRFFVPINTELDVRKEMQRGRGCRKRGWLLLGHVMVSDGHALPIRLQ
jgi:hypothetical protein